MGRLGVKPIPVHQLPELASWIHCNLPEQELQALLQGLSESNNATQCPLALELVDEEELERDRARLAAAYFVRLPGRVATLGGVRAINGQMQHGVQLVEQLVGQLRSGVGGGCSQIQAVVASGNKATQEIIRRAGLEHLTNVQHMWLNPSVCAVKPSVRGELREIHGGAIHWRPAQRLARNRMAQTLAKTFADTLDCPAINGLRSDDEVLSGFLNGRAFREMEHWEILEFDGQIGGCLILDCHTPSLFELVYMGINPELRGAGLGARLVERAVEISKAGGATMLVVAVDEQNWPAQQLYLRSGFHLHATLTVWLSR